MDPNMFGTNEQWATALKAVIFIKRLTCISTRLKEVNKEIEEVEWNCDTLELGPDKLQALYLEREHLQYLLQKGDFYVPNF